MLPWWSAAGHSLCFALLLPFSRFANSLRQFFFAMCTAPVAVLCSFPQPRTLFSLARPPLPAGLPGACMCRATLMLHVRACLLAIARHAGHSSAAMLGTGEGSALVEAHCNASSLAVENWGKYDGHAQMVWHLSLIGTAVGVGYVSDPLHPFLHTSAQFRKVRQPRVCLDPGRPFLLALSPAYSPQGWFATINLGHSSPALRAWWPLR